MASLVLTLLLFFGFPATAQNDSALGLTIQHAGFLGRYAIGPAYSFNPRHSVELTFGSYRIEGDDYFQINAGYIYSPWRLPAFPLAEWVPITAGVQILYAPDPDYFIVSPSHYPTSNYYEQTALRWGLQFGTGFLIDKCFEINIHTVILDSALVAIYNNDVEVPEDFIATGLRVRIYF